MNNRQSSPVELDFVNILLVGKWWWFGTSPQFHSEYNTLSELVQLTAASSEKKVSKTVLVKNHEGIDILVEDAAEYHIPTSVQKAKFISESEQRLWA